MAKSDQPKNVKVKIEVLKGVADLTVEVFDLLGHKVDHRDVKLGTTISFPNLRSGYEILVQGESTADITSISINQTTTPKTPDEFTDGYITQSYFIS